MERVSTSLLKVGTALLASPHSVHWGYELSRSTGVRAGTMYPILGRMLDSGWLHDGWEEPGSNGGRPPRRYYRLTEVGIAELTSLLAARSVPRSNGVKSARPQVGRA
ncbi:PadR family transcriptional regulator [Nocardioides sp. PD653]|uniref:PadR family transcriptional regulator n=2 Tax=unclassified Nocardioides TaxID=2615069 RepID=UPI0039C9FA69